MQSRGVGAKSEWKQKGGVGNGKEKLAGRAVSIHGNPTREGATREWQGGEEEEDGRRREWWKRSTFSE